MKEFCMELPENFRDEYYESLLECISYAKRGDHVRAVIFMAKAAEWEKRILASLDRDFAEAIILAVKGRAAERERELGLHLFTEQVNDLYDLRRTRTLVPFPREYRPIYETCDLNEWITVVDTDGELHEYNHIATIAYGDETYLELVCPDDIKTRRRLFYYRVDTNANGISLSLVEDESLHDRLSKITDNLL